MITSAVRDRLQKTRGFIFDMHGTLALGDPQDNGLRPLPGAVELAEWLTDRELPYVVCTSGTAKTPKKYTQELTAVGIDLPEEAMITPASVAAAVFARRRHHRVMALGNEGLMLPLREAGIDVFDPQARPGVDAVMVGAYRDFAMDSLEAACHAVASGARLYAASLSPYYATVRGPTLGTSAAISAMIRSVTGCKVEVMGKPSRHVLNAAARSMGVRVAEVAVVGDDPRLEVPMALRGGAMAIAVETGLGGPHAFEGIPASRGPHLSVEHVGRLLELLSGE